MCRFQDAARGEFPDDDERLNVSEVDDDMTALEREAVDRLMKAHNAVLKQSKKKRKRQQLDEDREDLAEEMDLEGGVNIYATAILVKCF